MSGLCHFMGNSSFLLLFLSLLFAGSSPANAQSQSVQARATPTRQSSAAKRGLSFSVGARGLDSVSVNGQSLLVSPESGALQQQKSLFRALVDALLPRSSSPSATPTKNTDTAELTYPWGRISCAYGKQGN